MVGQGQASVTLQSESGHLTQGRDREQMRDSDDLMCSLKLDPWDTFLRHPLLWPEPLQASQGWRGPRRRDSWGAGCRWP